MTSWSKTSPKRSTEEQVTHAQRVADMAPANPLLRVHMGRRVAAAMPAVTGGPAHGWARVPVEEAEQDDYFGLEYADGEWDDWVLSEDGERLVRPEKFRMYLPPRDLDVARLGQAYGRLETLMSSRVEVLELTQKGAVQALRKAVELKRWDLVEDVIALLDVGNSPDL